MTKTRAQAKDIPDADFVRTVLDLQREEADRRGENVRLSTGQYDGGPWIMIWDVEKKFALPPKVVLAKFDALNRRGLIDGCSCGCRGDLQVTVKGAEFLQSAPKEPTP